MLELKKSPKANLESKKPIFTQIGLVVVLSLVLVAFEWTWTDVNVDLEQTTDEVTVEEEIIPITRQDETPPPPPPPPAVTDVLNIVEDDADIDVELEIFDSELDESAMIDYTQVYDNTPEERDNEGEIFMIVEEMPEFPGGQEALQKYLAENIRYPVIAEENGIQGRVFVSFVINQKGEVTNATVMRGVDTHLDREALRVIQAMPKWKPGKQRNVPVRVSCVLPVNFVLRQR